VSRGGGRVMRGSLKEKIGERAMADVHAWAPGQVVKLFKAAVPTVGRLARGANDPRRLCRGASRR
jgi:hypothetical protein